MAKSPNYRLASWNLANAALVSPLALNHAEVKIAEFLDQKRKNFSMLDEKEQAKIEQKDADYCNVIGYDEEVRFGYEGKTLREEFIDLAMTHKLFYMVDKVVTVANFMFLDRIAHCAKEWFQGKPYPGQHKPAFVVLEGKPVFMICSLMARLIESQRAKERPVYSQEIQEIKPESLLPYKTVLKKEPAPAPTPRPITAPQVPVLPSGPVAPTVPPQSEQSAAQLSIAEKNAHAEALRKMNKGADTVIVPATPAPTVDTAPTKSETELALEKQIAELQAEREALLAEKMADEVNSQKLDIAKRKATKTVIIRKAQPSVNGSTSVH